MNSSKFWNVMHRLATQQRFSSEDEGGKASLIDGLIRVAHANPEHRTELLALIAGEMAKEARGSKRMRRLRRRKKKKKIPLFKAVGVSQEKWQEMDEDQQIKLAERAYERLSKRKSLSRKQKRIMTTIRFWYMTKGRKFRAKRRKFFDRIKRMKERMKR